MDKVNKNMKLNKIYILFGFLVVLIFIYFINIYYLNRISGTISSNFVKLSIVVVNPTKEQCGDCFDVNNVVKFIASSKAVKITKEKTITAKDANYNSIIEKNGIKNLPAVVISGDISSIKISKMIKSLYGVTKKGNIIIQNLLPYYDIKTQNKKGFIEAILLKDKTCGDCFDVTKYLGTLRRLGMYVATSSVYDISSEKGKSYIKKYNIKEVPVLLMSPAANYYPGFKNSWQKVGTIAPDGWFIFREVQKTRGKYRNI